MKDMKGGIEHPPKKNEKSGIFSHPAIDTAA